MYDGVECLPSRARSPSKFDAMETINSWYSSNVTLESLFFLEVLMRAGAVRAAVVPISKAQNFIVLLTRGVLKRRKAALPHRLLFDGAVAGVRTSDNTRLPWEDPFKFVPSVTLSGRVFASKVVRVAGA